MVKQRLKLNADSVSIDKALADYCKKFDPRTEAAIYRLPKQELRDAASMPCPSADPALI